MILVMARLQNLELHEMDVKTSFSNGYLEEELYMQQRESLSAPGQEKKVCKLVKSIYGLKQTMK